MSWLSEYPLRTDDARALAFHEYFYSSGVIGRTNWFGVPLGKCAFDLLAYMEIIHQTKPDVIVETGTNAGGSALFFAHLLDINRHGGILTVDTEYHENRPKHPRIRYIQGSSTAPAVIDYIRETVNGGRVLVSLDSVHAKEHVLAELELYAPLVKVGDYLVVEDTNLNGNPVAPHTGPGPMEALEEYLSRHVGEFEVDESKQRWGLTMSPAGWLRRIA
ncbi:MAG TPA: CmcI family methyltransferase [Gemmatimonadales bacterium]|nr:CmcI family methyltransferase [Gemmatimonadales bacterium]